MRFSRSRLIVITGATRGCGAALALAFAKAGHQVAGCGRSAAPAGQGGGGPFELERVDVADDPQVKDWAERVITRHGPPDLLINNAGVINPNAPLWKVGAEDFSRVIDINLKGVANVIRHFAPPMIARNQGVIVNMSSGWGRSVAAEVAPYCATKWAIEGLTQALAQELPAGMAAVPLNPGIIDTDMLRSCFGNEALTYPSPERWAKRAVPFILELGPKDNGQPLSVP